MTEELITVEWEHGKPLSGWVQIIDDGIFEGAVLLREPMRDGVRDHLRVFDPRDDELPRTATDWQETADKGPVYSDDVAMHRVEYRQAMADWWRQVVEWVDREES